MNLIKKTQTKESDIFGFGEYVRAKEPRFWNKQIRTTKAWQDMYKDVTFDFSVSVRMRRIGMKAK